MAKVKPKKVEIAFCPYCGKRVKFRLYWEGVATPTRKGIIIYKELHAVCKECDCEIYVPAVNDVNVYRREKAYAEKVPEPVQIPIVAGELAQRIEEQLKMKRTQEIEEGIKVLEDMFEDCEACKPEKAPPFGLTGWICPKCGRGLSPYTDSCPCAANWEITCGTGTGGNF